MDKSSFLFVGLVACALMTATSSRAELYAGAALGQSEYKDIDQVQDACNSVGATCGVDEADTGVKIFGGVQMTDYLAFEVGYIDFGSANANATIPVEAEAELGARGGFLALLPQIPIGDIGAILGRVGLSALDADLKARSGALSEDDSIVAPGLVFGLGGVIHLGEHVSLRAEWERHSFDEAFDIAGEEIDAPDLDMISGSILFRF